MKALPFYITFQFLTLSLFGQLDSAGKSFIFNILKKEPGSDTIIYTDRIKPITIPSISKVFQKDKIVGFEMSTKQKIELSLSPAEKVHLRKELKLINKTKWADSLFPDSRMIFLDSMWQYILWRNKEFSDTYFDKIKQGDTSSIPKPDRVSFCSVFQFSKPIFLKNNTIVIFYFLRLCGVECGVESLSIYKLQDGGYKKWLMIEGAAF